MTAADQTADTSPTLRGSVPPLREWARTFAIGICMGSADAVPGVSGGTIALIAGIYGRLIAMITAITPDRIWQFLTAFVPTNGGVSVRDALDVWDEVDGWFGLALVAGVATAVVVVTRAVHVLSENAPTLLFGFFFGLIAASAIVLLRELSFESAFQVGAAVTGFVLAFVLSGPTPFLASDGLVVVFVAGAVAVSAMILPGISGSLLLVILGQYTRMSDALSNFIDSLIGLLAGGSLAQVVELGTVVVTFILGGLVGLFTVSRAVRRALDRNRRATMAFLVALVVGALRAPVFEVRSEVGFSTDVLVAFAGAALVGAALLLVLDWYAVDLDLDSV
ncbi:DUF368 domain-containing protein [Haloarcula sp. JP-L23]|uniref:DUF368 domain-containing protein n=1 Tax=Haloarcula sp. JP-L23 TaxID=2716717 RepID=UPI00140F25CB|nr:DUF368 domain-containing protein [Haloarcula sp. JP-L23]